MASPSETHAVVSFNGVRYNVTPQIGYNNLAEWESKTVFGDYTRDSDRVISSKIWSSFVGGIGVDRLREGSDEGRYWFGTLDGRHPYQLSLGRLATSYSDVRYPLGDLDNTFYAADADQVFPWSESGGAFGSALTNSLSSVPIWKGVSWGGYQYIPLGDGNGYAYHNGTTLTEVTSDIDVFRFIDWDNRLIALTPGGEIYESFDKPAVSGTWSGPQATINTSESVKNVAVYTDRGENETVYVVTDRNTYAYDPVIKDLVRTRLQLPPHPDNGQGVAMWRPGEDLFISAGLGVYRFNLSVISPVGLDRDEGVPATYRGVIRDLEPEHNMLIAYLEGVQTATEASQTIEFDPGQTQDNEGLLPGTDSYSLIVGYNGFGWHPLWASPDASGTPVWSVVSGAESTYRLWWGYGVGADDRVYTQLLPRSFANPRQLLETLEGEFASSGYLDTGWFDANMQEFTKIASHLEVNVESASATETITVSYRKNYETNWTLLGNIMASGKTTIPFNVSEFNGQDFSYGLPFDRIRFRIEMARGSDETQTPIIDSIVLKFLKVPLNTQAFRLAVLMDAEDLEGRGPNEIANDLDDLVTSDQFHVMQIGDLDNDPYRARVSYVSGSQGVGGDPLGARGISIVAVPLTGYQGRGAGL